MIVRWLDLPDVAEKGDLSDYLDAGHSADDLRALVVAAPVVTRAQLAEPVASDAEPAVRPERKHTYKVIDGELCLARPVRGGVKYTWLCNFEAHRSEVLVLDGGVDQDAYYVLEGQRKGGIPLPPARIRQADWLSTNWLYKAWPGQILDVAAGAGTLGLIREGIEALSNGVRTRRIFTDVGWHAVDGSWVFITSGGAVGHPEIGVELEPWLQAYRLPTTPEDPAAAFRTSLATWELGPLAITVPLWASMYRAPLAQVLGIDFSIWIEGDSNALKTSTALLFLSHFGSFDDVSTAPATWDDTGPALERKRHYAKDHPLYVDDYVRESEEAEAKATRVVRSQGNRASRARLQADLTAQKSYPPRGLFLATGEHRPPGFSLAARTLVLRFAQTTIDRGKLDVFQGSLARRLPHAMAGYVAWLAPQIGTPAFARRVRAEFLDARRRAREARATTPALRIPEVIASVWVGVFIALEYGVAVGVLSGEEAGRKSDIAWQALLGAHGAQEGEVDAEREDRRFGDALWSLLTSREATLLPRTDFGESYAGRARLMGWYDAEELKLMPETAYQLVQRLLSPPLRSSLNGMGRQLRDGHVLVPDAAGNPRKPGRVAGRLVRCWVLRRDALAKLTGEAGWLTWPESTLERDLPEGVTADEPF